MNNLEAWLKKQAISNDLRLTFNTRYVRWLHTDQQWHCFWTENGLDYEPYFESPDLMEALNQLVEGPVQQLKVRK
jgi:hypothetical protein